MLLVIIVYFCCNFYFCNLVFALKIATDSDFALNKAILFK